jgi:hypothetical protein
VALPDDLVECGRPHPSRERLRRPTPLGTLRREEIIHQTREAVAVRMSTDLQPPPVSVISNQ